MSIVFRKPANLLMLLALCMAGCGADQRGTDVTDVETFKAEFQAAVPTGTSREEVETYLRGQGLEYSYVDDERTFYAIKPDLGRFRVIYSTSLLIRVRLGADERVVGTEFELEHTGL